MILYIQKLINKMKNREALNAKVKQMAKLYSSTILEGITKELPDLDPTISEVVAELSMSSFIDGATIILDALEDTNNMDENEKDSIFNRGRDLG